MKAKAVQSVKGAIAFENEQKASRNAPPTTNLAFYEQTSSGKNTPPVDDRGSVWVDPQGTVLDTGASPAPKAPMAGPNDGGPPMSASMQHMASLDSTQRSMFIWCVGVLWREQGYGVSEGLSVWVCWGGRGGMNVCSTVMNLEPCTMNPILKL